MKKSEGGLREALLRHSGPLALVGLMALSGMLGGCATTRGDTRPEVTVVFPPPPLSARVLYLGSISSPLDLPPRRTGFAAFVLGPEPLRYNLVKPINATLHGSRLFVCDTVVNTVYVYDLVTGDHRPLAGDRAAGKIRQPNNLRVGPNGNIYVADKIRQAVLVYSPDERFLTAFGRPGEASPVDIEIIGDELFVCDIVEHEIEVWSLEDGRFLRSFGGLGNTPGKFFMPTYLARDNEGYLYVTDTGNHRVQKLTAEGVPMMSVGSHGNRLGQFAWPKGVAVDPNGHVFVADSRFANVQIFDQQGQLLLFFGGPGRDRGNLDLPAGMSIVPWPQDVPWLRDRLTAGFRPESLAIVVNQQGPGFVNFFAVAETSEDAM